MTAQDKQDALALRLQERAVLIADGRPVGQDGRQMRDRLRLADATLLEALAGTRLLTPNERTALAASPLTLRRLRQLSLQSRAATMSAAAHPTAIAAGLTVALEISAVIATNIAANIAANDADWRGSTGMLRAASTAAETPETAASLVTDDNCWTLHCVPQDGGWQVILALSAQAPFAARLLSEQPLLRVVDGAGATILQGRLDADGECECVWPFTTAPASHFQQYGASFAVQPVLPMQPVQPMPPVPPVPPEAP